MKRHLLCVDEDSLRREQLAKQVARHLSDVRIETAADTTEVIELCENHAFDCIVSAYQLSDGDGVELLRSVRASHPKLPFILFTETRSEAVASEAISAGVTDYVRKGEPSQYQYLTRRLWLTRSEAAVLSC